MSRVKFAWAVLGIVAVSRPCIAQTCDVTKSGFSQNATIFVKTDTNSCTVPDGGYIKAGVLYTLHVTGTMYGSCQTYTPSGGQCVPLNLWPRYCSSVATYINNVQNGSAIVCTNQPQTYSTCSQPGCSYVNTGGGKWWTPTILGQYVYTAETIAGGGTIGGNNTYCNMSGVYFAADNTITMNVMQCKPNWLTDSNGNIVHLVPPTPPLKIKVFLDPTTLSGAATALNAAIADWNTNITASTGVEFDPVSTPCSGTGCVTVQAVSLGSCGYTPGNFTDGNGGITGAAVLQINTGWSSWSTASLQRTCAHELGHLLGLADHDNACDTTGNSAVMQANFSCNPTANPLTTLTKNDFIPVNNTVYGGHSRMTCGF